MTQHADRLQESVDGLTAIEHTKRGYGLWRDEVIHPADARMDAIIASGDPITDTKGLGLRYVAVRGERVLPHFRVHDPEKFSAALDRAFPAVHDAIVRVVAEDIQTGGYDALVRWCEGQALPEAFHVADVAVEKPCCEGGVSYRPDIVVAHGEGGRIELEVVNTHAPEGPRVEAAWAAGHIVLTLRVRDIVEHIVFSDRRDVVPDDDTLREMLRGRRFRLAGRERVGEAVLAVWRDLNLAEYVGVLATRVFAETNALKLDIAEMRSCADALFFYAEERFTLLEPTGAIDDNGRRYEDYLQLGWRREEPIFREAVRVMRSVLEVALRALPDVPTPELYRGEQMLESLREVPHQENQLGRARIRLKISVERATKDRHEFAQILSLAQRRMLHTQYVPNYPETFARDYPA